MGKLISSDETAIFRAREDEYRGRIGEMDRRIVDLSNRLRDAGMVVDS